MENRTVAQRKKLVNRNHEQLSIRRQCEVLVINRSSLYYQPKGENKSNLSLMEKMDRLFMQDPTLGVLGMQDELKEAGIAAGEKRIRRLLRKMGVEPIYPRRNLTKRAKAKYIRPYLLRNLKITHSNQVWAIDITYIPMKHGFMYLTAIIDLYSRYIVGWQLSNSLEKETQTVLLKETISRYGKPQIINSDQGSQYTCENWVCFLQEHAIKISMDGKGRARDNSIIERFFRTLKWKYIYLYPSNDGLTLYKGIQKFMGKYNERRHQGINRRKPSELYQQAA